MENVAKIVSITYKPERIEPQPPDFYARIPVESANLVVGRGIEGDRKGSHPKRQLNIMAAETIAQLTTEGYETAPGQLGEQIVISGIAIETLPVGTVLQIGDSACIEIFEMRNGCDRFQHIQGHPKALTVGRLGAIGGVVTAGTIRVGDSVTVRQPDVVKS